MTEQQVAKRQERPEEIQALLPQVDVYENKDGILLVADLPGVSKDKLELRVDNDTLLIEADIVQDAPENMEAAYAEVHLSRYRRAFSLSSELDSSRIDAQLRDGVLNLRTQNKAVSPCGRSHHR